MIISGGATITGAVTINTNYVPNAPTIGLAVPLSAVSASVQFIASTSTGGLAITSYTAVSAPGNITSTIPAPVNTSTGTIVIVGLSTGTSYTFSVYATNAAGNSTSSAASNLISTLVANSSTTYPIPGTYSWIAPVGVNVVSVLAVGAGGGGAGTCSFGGKGGDTYFIGTSIIYAGGGQGGTSSTQSLSTGTGTSGMVWYSGGLGGGVTGTTGTSLAGGGGGAGGYSGNGNSGTTSTLATCTVPGSGAGGGGGAKLGIPRTGAGGGGVGIYGRGCTGQSGFSFNTYGQGGQGGSRGVAGCNGTTSGGQGGLFGGGGGSAASFGGAGGTLAYINNYPVIPGNSYTVVVGQGGAAGTGTVAGGPGGSGVVRILWPGQSRLFPTTCVSASCIACGSILYPSTASVVSVTLTNYTSAVVTYNTSTPGVFYTITSYTAVATPGGYASSVAATTGTGTITVSNLRPNTVYTFTVYANSIGGTSLSSTPSTSVTTPNVPSTPIIGVATATGGTTALVGYTASTSSGGAPITGYVVGSNPGGATGRLNTCSSGVISVSGLSANSVYNFYVYATNALGTSANSANSNNTTTWTVPYTPTILVSTVSNAVSATVLVRPGAFNGGGGPITYTVLSNPGGGQGIATYCGACAVPVVVNNLTAATTYSFYAYASNTIGNSGLSAFLGTVTTFSTATPPIITVATATGISSALVGYIASTATGGPITSYNVITSPVGGYGFINTATSGVIPVSNLTPGTQYQFAVYATNQYGNSSTSSWSNSVTTFGRPLAPTITAVTATGATTALVGYTAPSNSGSVITSYTALSVPAGGFGTVTTCGSGVISVSGLPLFYNSYQFYVYATNAAGAGTTSSLSTTVSMITTASRPVIVSAAPISYNSALVTFNVSTQTGAPVTQYTAIGTPLLTGTTTGAGSVTPCGNASINSVVVTGLTANSTYTFYVYASNLYGNSSSSTVSTPVITYGPPTAPFMGSAVGGPAGTAVVSFSPPAKTNGYPVTAYTVVTNPAGGYGVANGCASSISVVGLTPGTPYNFTVYASNAAGNSTNSNYSNTVTLFGQPTPPVVGIATATGVSSAVVGYTASTASGFTITSYTAVSVPPGGFGNLSTSSSGIITVNGLTPNTIYSFYVYATNIYGTGTSITVSNTVTTFGVPGRPIMGVATATNGSTQAQVSYAAPATNNGYPITSYTAYSTPGGGIGTINTSGSGIITVNGLQPNSAYSFSVYATNSIGNSTTSTQSNSITTFGTPTQAIIGIATATGPTTAIVGYNASTATGFTISEYVAVSYPAGGVGIINTCSSGVITVSGLQPLTTYNFAVYAVNVYGQGTTSTFSNSATTYGNPYPPVMVAATATGYTSATITYGVTTTTNPNLPVLAYTAISNPGSFTGTIFTSSGGTIVVNGLSSSTSYTFRVYATNALGTGTISTSSNTVTTYGSILFTTASSYSWVVPWGVNSVSVLAVGGGGGGAGTAVGTTGSNSWFITGTVLLAGGGGGGGYGASPALGGFAGTASGAYCGGYAGGIGGYGQIGSNLAGGGGGAGGYTAPGGAGSTGTTGTSVVAGSSTGYGGGGGGVRVTNFPRGGGGGGVGVYGIGGYSATVAGGVTTASNGGGGSGGAGGLAGLCAICAQIGYGGIVGGGGGGTFTATFAGGAGGGGGALAYINNWAVIQQNTYFVNVGNGGAGGGTGVFGGGPGSTGTIRIVWPGNVRQFPNTCAGFP